MKYFIDYSKSIFETKRLKINGEFRDIPDDNNLYEDDQQFSSWHDANNWFSRNTQALIDGVSLETKPESYLLGSGHFEIRPYRDSKPQKYLVTKDELKTLLLQGNDEHYNMLVLDFDGYPQLVPKPSFSYAVRLEGYVGGNGYVGKHSKLNHLNDTYSMLLEAWLLHLQCSKSIYKDYKSGELSDEELISEIYSEIER
ncbi:hypothetical protein [Paenibacillus alvei]|uniref:Uncharacterized protein n=1 Tax=Paenibacillus alvei TaxID=44250 RepID=A0A383RFK1_PAEAL|nr:hypothetical protein [Paenibacillus alvei]SYX85056.1 conserved protein of unknown function [Paenibacillus alvei]